MMLYFNEHTLITFFFFLSKRSNVRLIFYDVTTPNKSAFYDPFLSHIHTL